MKTKKRKKGIPRLIEIAGEKKGWLICSAIIAIISTLAQFIPYITVYKILKELAMHASSPNEINTEFIWHWSYIALGSFIVYGVFLFISTILSHIAAFNILYELRVKLSNKLSSLPLGYFSTKTSGHIKKIMAEDVERIELFVAHHIPDIISAIFFPLFIIGYMFVIDWRLAIIVLLIFVIAMTIMSRMNNSRMKGVAKQYVLMSGKMNSNIVEFVKGIQVVKIFNRSTNAFESLNKNIDNFQKFSANITKQWSKPYLGFNIILNSVSFFLIPASIYFLLKADSYSGYIPTVLMFMILGFSIFFPMLKLLFIGGVISQVSVGVEAIDEILYAEELIEAKNDVSPEGADIEFDNVSFSYDAVPIIDKITFTAKEGSVTALVGPSGAGKTTLAMLAARFWDIGSGEIRIGGVPIKDISSAELMNSIGFVFQDNMLFFDTIEENIRMGNSASSQTDVINAAKAAQCHEFISKLPQGYKTLVGEGGTYLSGGEQQRISLARAILKNAPIVLLDEATAYADPENENKILKSFSTLIKNKTVLVIAHRLNTIVNADQILYIDQKKILEQGTHDELLQMNGKYAKMWHTYSTAQKWIIGKKKESK